METVNDLEGLSAEQVKFLEEYAFSDKTMEALLRAYRVTPRKLAEWRANPVFARELECVDEKHHFTRECDTRKGGAEHARRTRLGAGGERRMLGWRQMKAGKEQFEQARKGDAKFRLACANSLAARKQGKVIVVNPIHPRFAHEALALIERLEALQRRAEKVRKGEARIEDGG